MIQILAGEPQEAERLLAQLPQDSRYYALTKLTLPGQSNEESFRLAREIIQKGWRDENLMLTAGRHSVLNGMWDFTPSYEYIKNNRNDMRNTIDGLYHDGHDVIYDIMIAEGMYQRNKVHEALVFTVGKIPFLRKRQDMRLLFVALTLEIYILIANGQTAGIKPMIENLRQMMVEKELQEYIPNIEAMEAWGAMYEGDYVRLNRWLCNEAPDEYNRFCMLDVFRYMIKIRAYIVQKRYMLVTVLGNKLLPLLENFKRYMDTAELHMLMAMSDHAAGLQDEAMKHMKVALELSERYRYDRMIADEGIRVLELLKLYRKQYGKTPYLEHIIELAKEMASVYPRYMKSQLPENPALTQAEVRVLRLLAEEFTNVQIAAVADVTVDTVKQHCRHICSKLEVKNRHQAVRRAVELGILSPTVYRS